MNNVYELLLHYLLASCQLALPVWNSPESCLYKEEEEEKGEGESDEKWERRKRKKKRGRELEEPTTRLPCVHH